VKRQHHLYSKIKSAAEITQSCGSGQGGLRWPRLFGQFFRFDEWNLCRG